MALARIGMGWVGAPRRCCAVLSVLRCGSTWPSFFLSPAEFGSEKMTRRNKCDVQVQASERESDGPFFSSASGCKFIEGRRRFEFRIELAFQGFISKLG